MSTNQTTSATMSDEQPQTEMFDVQLIADTEHGNHDACVDGCWFTLDEIKEIYTEVIEQETPKRDSYVLDDLASLDFYHNYDGTYTLGDYDEATTLEPIEWEAICEWFMQEFEDSQEDEYINDLHEYLQTDDSVVDWEKTGDFISVDVQFVGSRFFGTSRFDVHLRTVDNPMIDEAEAFVSIDGPDVDEIIEAESDTYEFAKDE